MREEVQAFKRERILQAAVALFYEHGFSGTTLDDIAHSLGVTKPFIYAHFRSKNELLAAICLPCAQLSVEAAASAVKSAGTPSDRLRRLVTEFTRVVVRKRADIAIYFREEKNLPPEFRNEIDTLRKKFDRLLGKILQDGVSSGEFRIPDLGLATLAIGGMVSWVYTWHRSNGRLPVDELCKHMSEFALCIAHSGAKR